MEIFEEHAPTNDTLGGERVVSEVLVIRVQVQVLASVQPHPKLFQRFDKGKKLFFDGAVVLLRTREFPRVEGNWTTVLFDGRSELIIACVRVDVKRFVRIGVVLHCVCRNHVFELLECCRVCVVPLEMFLAGQLS